MSAPGQLTTSRASSAPGSRHADVAQPVVERPQVGLLQVAQREVLAVRDAHVEVEVALDVGERAELLRR